MKIYPTLRYDDPRAAPDWLERVIGFESVAVHEGEDGKTEHAEMCWGEDGKIEHAEMCRGEDLIVFGAPTETMPKSPVILYLTREDPDAAHAKAKAAGGEITMELVDQDYSNREFAVGDPEGHTWSFGTYEPR
ncbi:VOC family protein [soil metagenome]